MKHTAKKLASAALATMAAMALACSGEGWSRSEKDIILGFTAVIFQHECDHLDGVLYTDYLN